jgi:hypothetical protein
MNEETLEWLELERRKQNGTYEKWEVRFLTDCFYVVILGGEETKSDPPTFLDHISQYKTVVVELYDRGEPIAKAQIEEWEKPYTVPNFGTFNFKVVVFPHRPIFARHDKRFKEQSWAEKFTHVTNDFAPRALLTLDEIDEAMKYLTKLDNLIAFL